VLDLLIGLWVFIWNKCADVDRVRKINTMGLEDLKEYHDRETQFKIWRMEEGVRQLDRQALAREIVSEQRYWSR